MKKIYLVIFLAIASFFSAHSYAESSREERLQRTWKLINSTDTLYLEFSKNGTWREIGKGRSAVFSSKSSGNIFFIGPNTFQLSKTNATALEHRLCVIGDGKLVCDVNSERVEFTPVK